MRNAYVPRRALPTALAAVTTAVVMAACGGSNSNSTKSSSGTSPAAATTQSAATPSSGGGSSAGSGGTLVVGDTTLATSLDPDGPASNLIANLDAIENTYAPLVTMGTKPNPGTGGGEFINPTSIQPGLASSWTVHGNTWVFTLRKGITAANGDPFTAADVVYTYKRSLALKATGAFLWSVFLKAKSVTAPDPYHLQIVTTGPAPMLLDTLALAGQIWPLDAKAAKAHATKKDPWASAWLAKHSDGFGPFQLSNYNPPQSYVLTPNSKYYAGAPSKSVKVLAIADSAQRFSALQQGSIDVALNLTPQQVTQASSTGLHVFSFPGNSNTSVYLNSDVPQLRNPLVRQAMWYATPSEQIIQSVYQGHAFLMKSAMPAYIPGYTGKYYTQSYNLAKAKELLAKAGEAKGFSTQMLYATNDPTLASVATILQQSWAKIGIHVSLSPEPQATLVTRSFGQKNIPVYLIDTASQIMPIGTEFGALYNKTGFANSSNYDDPTFNNAFAASNSTLNTAKIKAATDTMQKAATENPVFIPVVGLDHLVVTDSKVSNWSWDPSQAEHFVTAVTGK